MKVTDKRLPVDACRPAREPLGKAARAISSGGLVVFPTSGLYGLGGDATRPEVAQRIFAIKRRPPDKPVLVLVKDRQMAKSVTREIPDIAYRIMDAFWPGDITLVLKAAAGLPEILTAGTGRIGIRLPRHPVAAALLQKLDFPLTGTSANISGSPGCASIRDLGPRVTQAVDGILDAGDLAGGAGSTIADVTGKIPVVLREGRVSLEDIESVWNR